MILMKIQQLNLVRVLGAQIFNDVAVLRWGHPDVECFAQIRVADLDIHRVVPWRSSGRENSSMPDHGARLSAKPY
jgi:hypothetical protein